jgi:hypothetical protein
MNILRSRELCGGLQPQLIDGCARFTSYSRRQQNIAKAEMAKTPLFGIIYKRDRYWLTAGARTAKRQFS